MAPSGVLAGLPCSVRGYGETSLKSDASGIQSG
jgi:hypothetical protein